MQPCIEKAVVERFVTRKNRTVNVYRQAYMCNMLSFSFVIRVFYKYGDKSKSGANFLPLELQTDVA